MDRRVCTEKDDSVLLRETKSVKKSVETKGPSL